MSVRDTSGLSAGSLRRCVRTVSDPRATTNSKRGLRQKICLPNEGGSLCAHHLHASRWRKRAKPSLVRDDHLWYRRRPAPGHYRLHLEMTEPPASAEAYREAEAPIARHRCRGLALRGVSRPVTGARAGKLGWVLTGPCGAVPSARSRHRRSRSRRQPARSRRCA